MNTWNVGTLDLRPSAPEILTTTAPLPGSGHPGTLTPEERANVGQRAGEKAARP
jgi:hypothetical protein